MRVSISSLIGSILDALQGRVDLEHLAKGLQAFHLAIPADVIASETVQQQGRQTIMGSGCQRALTA